MAIILHLFSDVANQVHLFKMCDETVTQDLCFRLRSIYRMSEFEITRRGTVPDNLYMVRLKSHKGLLYFLRCGVADGGMFYTRCALAKWSSAA